MHKTGIYKNFVPLATLSTYLFLNLFLFLQIIFCTGDNELNRGFFYKFSSSQFGPKVQIRRFVNFQSLL